jgi:crotonobetainyl-CoA:carnitine CoA-transferase CaiB-like acyl-CoA transferase
MQGSPSPGGAGVVRVFRALPKAELMARCERLGLPFAPIARPGNLFDDPHLLASGGLLPVDLSGAEAVGAPARPDGGLPGLPISLPGGRPGLRLQPPRAGEHGAAIAREAGLSEVEVAALLASGALATPERAAKDAAPPTPERAAAAVAAAE